jgi:hypothetical protein
MHFHTDVPAPGAGCPIGERYDMHLDGSACLHFLPENLEFWQIQWHDNPVWLLAFCT